MKVLDAEKALEWAKNQPGTVTWGEVVQMLNHCTIDSLVSTSSEADRYRWIKMSAAASQQRELLLSTPWTRWDDFIDEAIAEEAKIRSIVYKR